MTDNDKPDNSTPESNPEKPRTPDKAPKNASSTASEPNQKTTSGSGDAAAPASKPGPSPQSRADSGRTPGAKPSRKRRWGLWLLILLCLGLPLAAGFGVWWVWQDMEQQRATIAELRASLSEQSATLRQQETQLERLPTQIGDKLERELQGELSQARTGQSERLDQLERQFSRVERRLQSIASTDREDWKLAEAEYLLRLANQRLVLERDSGNALALAETADAILRDLGDSDLLPVRRALASDIEALKLADQVDREGIYLRLLALGEQLPMLPLVEPMRAPQPEADDTTETADDGTGAWPTIKNSFRRLVSRLGSHIRIRRHDQPIEALADPREQYLLRQRLALMLEQAQAALLREQNAQYQHSLERAADWLEGHYTLNPQTETVLARLRELSKLDIAPELPDLNEALNRLETHIERRSRLSPDFQSAPEADS